MPGPPPDPNARHRNGLGAPPGGKSSKGILRLPPRRDGDTPSWPLGAHADEDTRKAERALWAQVWAFPQAVAWERQGTAHREVAMYVRWSIRAEGGDPKAAVEARMMSDRLGLTAMAMRRLMWEVTTDEVADARTARKAAGVSTSSRRRTVPRAVDSAG